jgi:hypothetical protein
MCRVTGTRAVEDCFDGTRVREFALDAVLDEAVMRRLAEGGELAYYPEFPRPYFRIRRRGAFVIQGVIGKTTFRVTFDRSASKEGETFITSQVERSANEWAQNSRNTTLWPQSREACR